MSARGSADVIDPALCATPGEIAGAEMLDRYVSRLLSGDAAPLPLGLDPEDLRTCLLARDLAQG